MSSYSDYDVKKWEQGLKQLVKYARNDLDDLPDHIQGMLIGWLQEYLLHIDHHRLSTKCYSHDIDSIESRNGRIVAVLEYKYRDRELHNGERFIYSLLADPLEVPILVVRLYPNKNMYKISWLRKNGNDISVKMDLEKYHKFMESLESVHKPEDLYDILYLASDDEALSCDKPELSGSFR